MELTAKDFVFVVDSEFVLVSVLEVPLDRVKLNENRFYERSSHPPIKIGGVLDDGLIEIFKDFVPLYLGSSVVSVTHCMGEFGEEGPYYCLCTPWRLSSSYRSTT